MSDTFENLDKTFNVESTLEKAEETSKEIKKATSSKDVESDYEYTRGQLYNLIEKGQEAINDALEMAQETESPRAYEVTGQLIKTVADATEKLLDIQKKLKDIEEIKDTGPSNVTNALFIGSTADLVKAMKQQKNKTDTK